MLNDQGKDAKDKGKDKGKGKDAKGKKGMEKTPKILKAGGKEGKSKKKVKID